MPRRLAAAIVAASALGACTGAIEDDSPAMAPGAATPADPPPGAPDREPPAASSACRPAPDPGRSPLRRLNQAEYVNTASDLLALDAAQAASSFPPDEQGGGFSNNADALVVTGLLAGGYIDVAEKLAKLAVAKLGALLPCDPARDESACATQFVQRFGKRAFRRPLTPDEQAHYLALFDQGRSGGAFADGVEVAVRAFLQSPHFLYRVEVGAPAAPGVAVVAVTPHELASRLSYALWASMPDDALFTAAEAGRLATAAGVEAEARRMLGDAKARRTIAGFHREWFEIGEVAGISKDVAVYPGWSVSLRDDLRTELEMFIDQVFWNDGRLDTLLSAPYSYVNAALAKHYGVPAPTGGGFQRVGLDPAQRAGLVTSGALLALHAKPNQTSPVHRGKFVREQLLCQQLPSPPNNVVIKAPDVNANASTRDRFTQHSQDPVCSGCHRLMDPIGFGFEGFDGIGRWRTSDGKFAIDAHGEVTGSKEVDGPFEGAVELARKLASSADARTCVATQVFRFANGRAETAGDACTLERLGQRLDRSGHDMRELWVAIASSDSFRFRAVTGGGP